LIGDEMGLGKTIQALGFINLHENIRNVLVVCPASLRINWRIEAEKWLVKDFTIYVVDSSKAIPAAANLIIVNYDRLKGQTWREIKDWDWDVLIVDECHYCKNPKAARTMRVLGGRGPGLVDNARRSLFLSGTPILNRPVELHPIAAKLDPAQFGNWHDYVVRYCAGHQKTVWIGRKLNKMWDVNGASNLDELQQKLRGSIMVRRLKKDVLPELPPKRRQVIVLPPDGAEAALDKERAVVDRQKSRVNVLREAVRRADKTSGPEEYARAVAKLATAERISFTEISRQRHETALAKVGIAVEHIKMVLADERQLVVFAYHKDVVKGVWLALDKDHGPVQMITGDTSTTERNAAVEHFQRSTSRVIIGTIGAMGLGLGLTQSSTVIFLELDWTPSSMSQAEDRCHRIGQRDAVLVQHLVLDGSIDRRMTEVLVEKQEVLDAALDDLPGGHEDTNPLPTPDTGQNDAAIQCLRILAASREGFSQVDTTLGRAMAAEPVLTPAQVYLAAAWAVKYHGQLPPELVDTLRPLHKLNLAKG